MGGSLSKESEEFKKLLNSPEEKKLFDKVKKGDSIDETYDDNQTTLHIAAFKGYENIVKLLLEKNADVNVINDFNMTPLHIAAQYGHSNIVKLLLEKNANLMALNYDNKIPLALGKDDVFVVKEFAESTPNLSLSDLLLYRMAVRKIYSDLLKSKKTTINIYTGETNVDYINSYVIKIRILILKEFMNKKIIDDSWQERQDKLFEVLSDKEILKNIINNIDKNEKIKQLLKEKVVGVETSKSNNYKIKF